MNRQRMTETVTLFLLTATLGAYGLVFSLGCGGEKEVPRKELLPAPSGSTTPAAKPQKDEADESGFDIPANK